MLNVIGKLIKPKILGVKNQWQRASWKEQLIFAFFIIMGILFWLGLSGLFWFAIKTLYGIEIVGPIVLRKLMEVLMLSLFGLLFFSNVVTALSSFYLSDDLELLLSLPIHRVQLHIARLLETIMQSSWMMISLAFPILISYGIVYNASPLYYLIMTVVLICFVAIPGALGVGIASVLVSVFPARRIREALMLVGILMFVFVFVLLRWLQPEKLADSGNFENVAAYVAELQTPAPILTPPQWASDVLLSSLTGRDIPLLEFGLLIFGAIAANGVGRWVTDWLYDDGRSKAQEARAARLAKSSFLDLIIKVWTWPLSSTAKAIISKDIKTFVRDPSQWTQLFLVASIVVIALLSVASLPTDVIRGPWMKPWINTLAFLVLALVGFVMAALAARFQFSSVSNEGRGFWLVRTAPITATEFIWAKAWIGFLPMLVVGEALALSSTAILKADTMLLAIAGLTAAGLSFALSGLAVGMGALYPDFKADNAAKLAASPSGMLYMLSALALVFLSLALEAPSVFFIIRADIQGIPMSFTQQAIAGTCMLLTFAVWIAATIIPMRLGAKRLWLRELPNG